MIKKGENQDKIFVINDQFGCPTYSKDLVECTLKIIVSNKLNKNKVYNFSKRRVIQIGMTLQKKYLN